MRAPPYMGLDCERELVRRCHVDSLELDDNLPRLPCQIAHVPVAVKVRDQPGRGAEKKINNISNKTKKPNTPRHKHLKGLLDFLHSVIPVLVGPGHVLLGPFGVFVGVPAPDNHDVLPLLLFLRRPHFQVWFLKASLVSSQN